MRRNILFKTVGCFGIALLAISSANVQAAYYDFTATDTVASITGAGIDGTQYDAIFLNPENDTTVGTGVFDPFIRTQLPGNGSNNGGGSNPPDNLCGSPDCEMGYNTNGTEEFETKDAAGHNWNHAITLSSLATVDMDGNFVEDGTGDYYLFLLDINEPGDNVKKYLSLDELQFFVSNDENLTGYNFDTRLFDGIDCEAGTPGCGTANLAWEMDLYDTTVSRADAVDILPAQPTTYDSSSNPPCKENVTPAEECTPSNDPVDNPTVNGAENNGLRMDYKLFHGSGNGIDLEALIPKAAFDAAIVGLGNDPDNIYVTLFNMFGDVQYSEADSGFEEWAYVCKDVNCSGGGGVFPGPSIPEPGPMALFATGLMGLGAAVRRRRQRNS